MATNQQRDAKGRFIASGDAKETANAARAFGKLAGNVDAATHAYEGFLRLSQQFGAQIAKQNAAIEKLTKNQKSFGALFKVGFPGFVSAAAITASTFALTRYITTLSRTFDKARALGFGRDLARSGREAGFLSEFFNQRFSNRFVSTGELKGLRNITDQLSKALGPEFGQEIALKLTDSLKGSESELTRFLILAQTNLPEALKQFASADIEDFSTALAAVTANQDALTKAASNTERVMQNVTEIFESLAGIASPVIADIAGKLGDATDRGAVFRRKIIDLGEGIVSSILKGAESFGTFDIAVKKSYLSLLQLDYAIADTLPTFGLYDKNQYAREIEKVAVQIAELERGTAQRSSDLHGFFDKLRERLESTSAAMNSSVGAATAQRRALESLGSTAQQSALAIGRIDENVEILNASLGLQRARLARFESDPLGWNQAFAQSISNVSEIDATVQALAEKLRLVQSIENQTRADRLKALDVETQINDLIGERNRLLAGQRRGYLDAVQAQALVGGRFQKIIFQQDRSIRLALQAGIAATNKLLGGAGVLSGVQSFRFGTDPGANLAQYADHARDVSRYLGSPIGFNAPALSPQAVGAEIDRAVASKTARRKPQGSALNMAATALEDAAKYLRENERQSNSPTRSRFGFQGGIK